MSVLEYSGLTGDGEPQFDLVDLIPAQVAGLMFAVQFEIVQITAYDGWLNLSKSYAVLGQSMSLAFLLGAGSLAVIVATNELSQEDVIFWEEETGELEQFYGASIVASVGLLVGVEFLPSVANWVTGSDVIATAAFVVGGVAVWAIVWAR